MYVFIFIYTNVLDDLARFPAAVLLHNLECECVWCEKMQLFLDAPHFHDLAMNRWPSKVKFQRQNCSSNSHMHVFGPPTSVARSTEISNASCCECKFRVTTRHTLCISGSAWIYARITYSVHPPLTVFIVLVGWPAGPMYLRTEVFKLTNPVARSVD